MSYSTEKLNKQYTVCANHFEDNSNVSEFSCTSIKSLCCAGISALVTLKYLPDSAKDTAQFVEHFDGMFNTFNS